MAGVNVTFPGNLAQVQTAQDLRAIPSSFIADGDLYLVNGLQGLFEYDPGSLAADDGKDVIRPYDKTLLQAGRWIRNVDGLASGPQGETGPANSTYLTLSAMRAAGTTNRSYILSAPSGSDSGVVNGLFNYQLGNFTGRTDVVFLNSDPTGATGALVRLGAQGINNGASAVSDQIGRNLRMYAGYAASDVTTVIQQMIADGGGHIPLRVAPYVISSQIDLYNTVTIAPGVQIQWTGPTSDSADIYGQIGMFVPRDGAELSCAGSTGAFATFFCQNDQHQVYIVLGRGVKNVRFNNLYAKNCNHVAITAKADVYASVVTPEMVGQSKPGGGTYASSDVNISMNVTISGGGCEFTNADALTGAGTSVRYTYGFNIENLTWRRARNGLVVLGGNADTTADGALTNLRKTLDGEIRNVRCYESTGGAVVLLMNRGTNVWNSVARNNLDVGFDAEGCQDTHFYSCYAKDNVGGNLSTFYLTRNVTFNACVSVSATKEALQFSVYNVGQSADNRDVSLNGCKFVCTDSTGPGRIGTINGPIRSINITGCSFENVVLDLDRANNNQINVEANEFRFTLGFSSAYTAIKFGGLTQTTPLSYARARIANNVIHSEVSQPAGCVGIAGMLGEFNSAPNALIQGNRITMPLSGGWGGIAVVANSPNAGLAPSFRMIDNGLTGGSITTKTMSGTTTGNFSGLTNYDIDSNNLINLTPA